MADTSKHIEDGGPAFPQHDLSAYGFGPSVRGQRGDEPEDVGSQHYTVEGMTLRDYFAGKALAGIGNWVHLVPREDNLSPAEIVERRAHWSYAQADAMIAARKGGAA